jgi:hypothetical protein
VPLDLARPCQYLDALGARPELVAVFEDGVVAFQCVWVRRRLRAVTCSKVATMQSPL